jgi:hypothetical protein
VRCQSQGYITIDGQSASLPLCQAPIWGPRQIFLLSLIILRQLRICRCGAHSLTRIRSDIASASFLRPKSRGTIEHILLSLYLRLSNLEGQVLVFISPRNKVAKLYPQILGLFHLHIITCYIYSSYMCNTYTRPLSVQVQYTRLCPMKSISGCNTSSIS